MNEMTVRHFNTPVSLRVQPKAKDPRHPSRRVFSRELQISLVPLEANFSPVEPFASQYLGAREPVCNCP